MFYELCWGMRENIARAKDWLMKTETGHTHEVVDHWLTERSVSVHLSDRTSDEWTDTDFRFRKREPSKRPPALPALRGAS